MLIVINGVKSCDVLAPGVGDGLQLGQADIEAATAHNQMNITERSSKAAIIDAAMELTESQAEQIAQLQERQTVLLVLLGVLAILQLL